MLPKPSFTRSCCMRPTNEEGSKGSSSLSAAAAAELGGSGGVVISPSPLPRGIASGTWEALPAELKIAVRPKSDVVVASAEPALSSDDVRAAAPAVPVVAATATVRGAVAAAVPGCGTVGAATSPPRTFLRKRRDGISRAAAGHGTCTWPPARSAQATGGGSSPRTATLTVLGRRRPAPRVPRSRWKAVQTRQDPLWPAGRLCRLRSAITHVPYSRSAPAQELRNGSLSAPPDRSSESAVGLIRT
jgi:hypothetical protein